MNPRRTFARARQLVVVGVEFLVQDQEAMDLRAAELGVGGEVGVDLLDAVADEFVDLAPAARSVYPPYGDVALLGPVAHRLQVDVDEGADLVATVAEGNRFLDVGEELELVLDVLRARTGRAAVGELADVLGAVDDLQVTVGVEKPASPVWYQPSASLTSRVASGFL